MKKTVCMIAALLLLWGCGEKKTNTRYESFTEVKEILLNEIYEGNRVTFYCGCTFGKNKKVRCKVGRGQRASVVEWEHVVPASRFGKTFEEWKKQESFGCRLHPILQTIFFMDCRTRNARENARSMSKQYRLMESDMYNLVPAIGLINQKRSDLAYGEIPGEERAFGKCDFEVSKGIAEPAAHIRGDIARTYFYMDAAYPGRNVLPETEKKMFQQWDMADPVDQRECERAKRIEEFQGNPNSFVREACQKSGLW